MKRRNFLSGLLAAPLALKARIARFFARKPVELCGAPIFGGFVIGGSYQLSRNQSLATLQLLAEGKPMKEIADGWKVEIASRKAAWLPTRCQPVCCSLPRGHKSPHILLNPR